MTKPPPRFEAGVYMLLVGYLMVQACVWKLWGPVVVVGTTGVLLIALGFTLVAWSRPDW